MLIYIYVYAGVLVQLPTLLAITSNLSLLSVQSDLISFIRKEPTNKENALEETTVLNVKLRVNYYQIKLQSTVQ